jgi:hypothetical protein
LSQANGCSFEISPDDCGRIEIRQAPKWAVTISQQRPADGLGEARSEALAGFFHDSSNQIARSRSAFSGTMFFIASAVDARSIEGSTLARVSGNCFRPRRSIASF